VRSEGAAVFGGELDHLLIGERGGIDADRALAAAHEETDAGFHGVGGVEGRGDDGVLQRHLEGQLGVLAEGHIRVETDAALVIESLIAETPAVFGQHVFVLDARGRKDAVTHADQMGINVVRGAEGQKRLIVGTDVRGDIQEAAEDGVATAWLKVGGLGCNRGGQAGGRHREPP
jgi:hypothetical protein